MPKRRRGSDPVHDIIVIETPDGARLRCSIAAVGRETEPRWMVMDEDGAQFVGPVVTSERSADAVTRLIQDWWAATRTDKPPKTRTDPVAASDSAAAADRDGTKAN